MLIVLFAYLALIAVSFCTEAIFVFRHYKKMKSGQLKMEHKTKVIIIASLISPLLLGAVLAFAVSQTYNYSYLGIYGIIVLYSEPLFILMGIFPLILHRKD